jgi:hypothetical protein
MTDQPHLWEKLREAQEQLDPHKDLTKWVELILDNARVRADDMIFVTHRGKAANWHDVAIDYVRLQLWLPRHEFLQPWFAQYGVTS